MQGAWVNFDKYVGHERVFIDEKSVEPTPVCGFLVPVRIWYIPNVNGFYLKGIFFALYQSNSIFTICKYMNFVNIYMYVCMWCAFMHVYVRMCVGT